MKKSTQELFDLMKKTQAFDTYMEITKEERVETTVSAALEKLLEEKNINKSKCIEASGLDRTYAYQIFSGIKTPSRDKLLALCLGMGLTLEETQTLLKQTGYPPLLSLIHISVSKISTSSSTRMTCFNSEKALKASSAA